MTYSIVAHDPHTGQLGVAVQSHYFSVGSCVPWVEAGVGAVATQSMIEQSYGPLGLDRMRGGQTPAEALAALVAADEGSSLRQVGMVDATGAAAAHTGERAIREAGHYVGAGYSVHANMMLNPTVVDAMVHAYNSATGELALRMLTALDAAEAEGGDIRGKQSAALLISEPPGDGPQWAARVYDLRVEDSSEPLVELRRLVTLARAYRLVDQADDRAALDDGAAAARLYQEAHDLAPDSAELKFWHAVGLASAGSVDESVPLFTDVFAQPGEWRELLARLPAAGLFAVDAAVLERLITL